MRQVLSALGLNDVAVVALRLNENTFERMHLGQMADGLTLVGVWKPDAVFGTKT